MKTKAGELRMVKATDVELQNYGVGLQNADF